MLFNKKETTMRNSYVLNVYNFGKNRNKKVFDMKCRLLPHKDKEEYKEYKLILKTIYGFKKVM
jgi:hypothetical protein